MSPPATRPKPRRSPPSSPPSPPPAWSCPARSPSAAPAAAGANCGCHADPPRLHGPYWQWTRKIAAKTICRWLSADQHRDYPPGSTTTGGCATCSPGSKPSAPPPSTPTPAGNAGQGPGQASRKTGTRASRSRGQGPLNLWAAPSQAPFPQVSPKREDLSKGYIEQLPSGSFRVSVYVGTDPLTRRQIRLKATAKTEQQARIELGRLLKEASEGRTPESAATVAKLLNEYAAIAPWDVSTRQTNEGFIRRTIKPALGHLEARKVRGPILDQLYARLKRCGDLSCTGRPFTEHRNVPVLVIKGGRHYTASQLLAGGFDLRNTAARLGHSGGGATTLRHYANPVPEVDRRAAAYLAQLTARPTPSSPQP